MTTNKQELDSWFNELYNSAMEAVGRGWNLIPISTASKKPLVEWKKYQTELITLETVDDWFENGVPTEYGQRVKPFNLALVTGAISGVVVVDCDNEEATLYAMNHNIKSPFSVKTTRGRHYYFAHPRVVAHIVA